MKHKNDLNGDTSPVIIIKANTLIVSGLKTKVN